MLLILFDVLGSNKPFRFPNPLGLPLVIAKVLKLHTRVQDHGNSVYGRGVSERVVVVHLLTRQLHGRNDGRVVCHPSSLVEGVRDTVHSGNDGGDAGSVLGEKECCILVLLQKTVSSIWLMIYTDTHE